MEEYSLDLLLPDNITGSEEWHDQCVLLHAALVDKTIQAHEIKDSLDWFSGVVADSPAKERMHAAIIARLESRIADRRQGR